ncbi:hypothetical protein EDB83DRAFT_2373397, partial [Lactarius deliciosus]
GGGDLGLVTFFIFVVLIVHHYHRLLCRLLRLPPARSRAASSGPVVLECNLQHVHEFLRVRIVPCPRFPLGCCLALAYAGPLLNRHIVQLARAGREGR